MRPMQVMALVLMVLWASGGLALAQINPGFAVTVAPGAAAGTWDYTLYHNAPSDIHIDEFVLVWDDQETPGPAIAIVASPDWWAYDTDGTSYAVWQTLDAGPTTGESVSGFVVGCTPYLPVFLVTYYTDDPYNPVPSAYIPVELEPAVPEPGSLTVLLAGLACLGPAVRRFRR